MPEIQLKEEIVGEDAEKFAKCFVPGVIEVRKDLHTGKKHAVVANPREDTVSRECLRHPEFINKVVLARKKDHFICTFAFPLSSY